MHDDTLSFHEALRHVLRQDPNVILIGEMRDLETIEIALTLAETGHLVLATLHTGDASQALTRIIDVYPPHQQNQARTQLSLVLLCIMVQQLLRRVDGKGRILAYELLVATPAVCNLIRTGETQQVYSTIQTSAAEGMCTLNTSLQALFRQGLIGHDDMMHKSARPKELNDLISQRQSPASHARQSPPRSPQKSSS
jgi:twitching motility protein PilT